MVQERRGTYQESGGADPHPPSSLSPSFGRCVCLIHRGHPPTSPGPHPRAPYSAATPLREYRVEGALSYYFASGKPAWHNTDARSTADHRGVRRPSCGGHMPRHGASRARAVQGEGERCATDIPRPNPKLHWSDLCPRTHLHHLTRPSPSLPCSTMTLASGSRSSAISIRQR